MVGKKRALKKENKHKIWIYAAILLVGVFVFYFNANYLGKLIVSQGPEKEKYTGTCEGNVCKQGKGTNCNWDPDCSSLRCNPTTFSCDVVVGKNAPGTPCTTSSQGLSNECGHYGCTGTTCGPLKGGGSNQCDFAQNAGSGENTACYSAKCVNNACVKVAGSGTVFCTDTLDCISACKVNGKPPGNQMQQYQNSQCGPCSDLGCDGATAGKLCTACAPGQKFYCVSTGQSCIEGDPANKYTGLCGLKCIASTVAQKQFDDIVEPSAKSTASIGKTVE